MTEFNLTNECSVPYIDGEISPSFREYGAKRGRIGLFAIHGGGIEIGTEQIVRYCAERTRCSVYVFSGRKKIRNSSLRISSVKFALLNRPFFSNILAYVETIVAVHGHNQNDRNVYIGGRNTELKGKIAGALEKTLPGYRVVKYPHEIPNLMKGDYPNNFVNLSPEGGVQLELPRALREAKKTAGWRRHEWSLLYGDST
ncbi:unnamed protein product, partial [marine sediment metagenome]